VSLVSAAQCFSQQQLLYISMFVFVLQVFFEIFFSGSFEPFIRFPFSTRSLFRTAPALSQGRS
ncbi:hypothetical protein, partial [Saccharibacillus sp. O23]|uniref:hypothetical protein n=1 Tax=Saccharibacillus sp. O23 TaxID=2009338 RepID=UPI001C52F874